MVILEDIEAGGEVGVGDNNFGVMELGIRGGGRCEEVNGSPS